MFEIMKAEDAEYEEVRSFYYDLIDMMQDSEYHPAWEKGVYPADQYLQESIQKQNLYIGRLDGMIAAAMIFNHDCNESYAQMTWTLDAEKEEIMVIHALGVLPTYSGQGLAKKMVLEAISLAQQKNQKALRLDVLGGNLPAEKLYRSVGFQYVGTLPMFYEDTGWTDFLLFEYPLQNR